MSDPREETVCEIRFSPDVELVTTVRKFVSNLYGHVLPDAEMTSKLALAVHELLENAVRYSTDQLTTVRIGVRKEGPMCAVLVDTQNQAEAADIIALKTLLDEMAAAPDAATFYQKLMRESLTRNDGSGLGLGRVYAESDMSISCDVEGENAVHLRARAEYEEGPA